MDDSKSALTSQLGVNIYQTLHSPCYISVHITCSHIIIPPQLFSISIAYRKWVEPGARLKPIHLETYVLRVAWYSVARGTIDSSILWT